jgi:hypothetical protein
MFKREHYEILYILRKQNWILLKKMSRRFGGEIRSKEIT